mgnify:CR=1 FL=1
MTPDQFKTIRQALKMSQSQLGRQLGVHRNTIAAWELGQRPIPSAVAQLVPLLLTTLHGTIRKDQP